MSARAWLVVFAALVALSLAGYRATYQCVGAVCGMAFVPPGPRP